MIGLIVSELSHSNIIRIELLVLVGMNQIFHSSRFTSSLNGSENLLNVDGYMNISKKIIRFLFIAFFVLSLQAASMVNGLIMPVKWYYHKNMQ